MGRVKYCTKGSRHKYDRGYCTQCGIPERSTWPRLIYEFWQKVNKTKDCWLWTGSMQNSGYGNMQPPGKATNDHKTLFPHRFSLMLQGILVPPGAKVCHRCDVPLCVRPTHLFVGTQRDNIQDMVRKGRKAGTALTPTKVREIRKMSSQGLPNHKIASRMRVSELAIYRVVTGRSWKAVK